MGRPFQGRYKALLVAPGAALGQVCHYIHLDPVRAGLCAPHGAAEYRWSSLPVFAGDTRPRWLIASTVLLEAGNLPDSGVGWRSYLRYLEFLATDDLARRELVAQRMSRGWCVGDARFKADMKRAALDAGADLERYQGLEPQEVAHERAEQWETRLQALASAAKIDLGQLPPPKSHPAKALLAAAMKASSSVSNAWLARRLEMGQPASASQFARRWMLDGGRRAQVSALVLRVER